jgi:hypothetical protein
MAKAEKIAPGSDWHISLLTADAEVCIQENGGVHAPQMEFTVVNLVSPSLPLAACSPGAACSLRHALSEAGSCSQAWQKKSKGKGRRDVYECKEVASVA